MLYIENLLSHSESALILVMAFSALATIQSCFEWCWINFSFSDSGLFSWKLTRVELLRTHSEMSLSFFDRIFSRNGVLVLLGVQLIAAVVLIMPMPTFLLAIAGLIVSLIYFLMTFRGIDGFNGGDSMAKIVLLSGSIALLSGRPDLGLWFIAVQCVISYVTPALLRLGKTNWLNGEFLTNIVRQETFGRKSIWKFLKRNKRLAAFMSVTLIAYEGLFILVPFLPLKIGIPYLTIGVLFHFSNAAIMGLNTFFLPFTGSYIALLWVSSQLH